MKTEYDLTMKVKFCPKHLRFFRRSVRVKLTKGWGIRPGKLEELIRSAELCLDCEWRTTFGKR